MDLIYKIYSVYLYQNQLGHDWVFFYNRRKGLFNGLTSDLPWAISNALNVIYARKGLDPEPSSVRYMLAAAANAGITMLKGSDFISLVPLGEGTVSYSGAIGPGDVVEAEGEYKGLKKNVYTPYEVRWNETLSGFNPFEFEMMGVWQEGSTQCTSYRIWEEASERDKTIRDRRLIELGLE